MGVVTWKNIAPSNPAGILSAANAAAQAMGEGFSGVGTALQGGVDKKVQSETDDFISDLMSLETQAERDAMISEAETGWLNLDLINKTNYELGAPDREMDIFNQQLAAKTLVNQDAAQKLHDDKILQIQETNKYKSTSKPTSGIGSADFGKEPFRSGGIYDITLGTTDDKQWWMGPGMNDRDKVFLNQKKSDFLSLTRIQDLGITAEMFNELSNDSTITFDDKGLWKGGDTFNFTHEGKPYNIGHTNGWEDAMAEVIQNKYLKTQSTRQIDRTNYWDVFTKNNTEYVKKHGLEVTKDKFMSIYKRNKVGANKVYSADLATQIFGKMDDKTEPGTSGFTSNVPKDENYDQQVGWATVEYRNLNQENLEKIFLKLSRGKNLDSKDQARLEAVQALLDASDVRK